MGSESSKEDPNIDIYLEVSKPLYNAGEFVEGNVHLNVKRNVGYSMLQVKLTGKESCQLYTKRTAPREIPTNGHINYEGQFQLARFDNRLAVGQYTYPFRFTLPLSISGSYYNSYVNYIQYFLTAQLVSTDQLVSNKDFTINLNVREAPRQFHGPISTEQQTSGKCCGGCIKYGITKISLSSNQSTVMTGDNIKVRIAVDNSRSTGQLSHLSLTLTRRMTMAIGPDSSITHILESYPLQDFKDIKIKSRKAQTLTCQVQIPQKIKQQTAIGTITAIWFTLDLKTQEGCCNSEHPEASLFLTVQSRSPSIIEYPQRKALMDWSPMIAPLVTPEMKPFVHEPLRPLLNLISRAEIASDQSLEKMSVKPNFGDMSMPMVREDDPYQSQYTTPSNLIK